MARLRGRPLATMTRRDFEAFEQRVEDAALDDYLAREVDGPDEPADVREWNGGAA